MSDRSQLVADYTKHAIRPKPDPQDPNYQNDVFKHLGLPDDIYEASCGGGCPLAFAPEPLDSKFVVDLGCGGGHDVVIAAKLVGESGHVVGVDLTAAMLERAQRNASRCGVSSRTSFVEGAFDSFEPDLPHGLTEGRADLVISNGAFNLALDKPAAFRTAYRVAAPGAHFCLTDVMVAEGAEQEGRDCMQSSCAAAAQETSANIKTQPTDAVPSSD